ncbi:hypothetical protein BN938_0773 [Mucinivorans hirudinis]|uniref:Uncharacterized protein n=1 Tax=Mucinivorans hirudinis TaxID=1433126 RepID=A0A060R718_9BACT|nr:hypothetical protein BN938_0773 [Mucinivorans hirudinis]
MTEYVSIITILSNIFALFVIWNIWRWKIFVHPGAYFSVLWAISVMSEWYLVETDLAMTPNPQFIDELNLYGAFASFCFAIFSLIGQKYSRHEIKIEIVSNKKMLLALMWIAIVATIANFIYKGATLSFATNRGYGGISDVGDHIYREFTVLDSLLSIFTGGVFLYTIYMGYALAKKITDQKELPIKRYLIIALPFVITFLSAVIIGGRNPIVSSIKLYVLGIGFGLPLVLAKKSRKRIILLITSALIAFSMFSSYVADERIEIAMTSKQEYDSEILNKFAGIMDYMSAHYWGYQLRRTDYADGNNLLYGKATLYGLGDIRIPFSSMLGINSGLLDVFGIEYDNLDIYKDKAEGYYTTSTIFMPMVRDYGLYGTFLYILIVVIVTQYLFLNVIKKTKCTGLSLVPFYIVFTYWSSANFNVGLGGATITPILLSVIVYDILQNNYSSNVIKNKRLYSSK